MTHYERTTNGISVTVEPQYLDDRSRPDEGYFVWAYTVTIVNHGERTMTLKTRYWKIVDANGRVQEVRGAGVVGEQPTLQPGGSFRYTSGAPLATCRQVHSSIVRAVRADADVRDDETECDAVTAERPGLLLGIKTADCVPVLIADRRTGAAAAVHAGWRGTASRIVERSFASMMSFRSDWASGDSATAA